MSHDEPNTLFRALEAPRDHPLCQPMADERNRAVMAMALKGCRLFSGCGRAEGDRPMAIVAATEDVDGIHNRDALFASTSSHQTTDSSRVTAEAA